MTAKPTMSTYSWSPPLEEVATLIVSGRRWVTFFDGLSPFIPVTRTTTVYWPGGTVPVLMVSVDDAPLPFAGVTLLGLKVIAPRPDGSARGGLVESTDRETAPPNAL